MNKGFEFQLNRGQRVEDIVQQHLESRGHKVINKTAEAAYQSKDTDFIVDNGQERTTLEVKLDNSMMKTGNIVFEVCKQYGTKINQGWLSKCEAQYMCKYSTASRKGIIFDYQAVCSLLEQYGTKRTFYDYQDGSMDTIILLPLSVVREKNLVYYEWSE